MGVRVETRGSSCGTNLKVKSRGQGGLKMQEVILKKLGLNLRNGSDLPAQEAAALRNICKHKIREELSGPWKGFGVSH